MLNVIKLIVVMLNVFTNYAPYLLDDIIYDFDCICCLWGRRDYQCWL